MSEQDVEGYWNGRYAEREQLWPGNPNQALVSTISGLRPGRALDLGCGEGGDSIWLAEQGWQVTGVDIAGRAVERGRAQAAVRHIPDGQITWCVEDLSAWRPTESYDLVSACFLHSRVELPRTEILQRAAAAVAQGGHLLVVGHAEPPPWTDADEHAHERFVGPDEEVVGLNLDAGAWRVVVSEIRSREAKAPEGEPVTMRDAVVLLRRMS